MKAKIVLLLAFSISIGINLSFGQTLQEFFSIGSNTFFDEAIFVDQETMMVRLWIRHHENGIWWADQHLLLLDGRFLGDARNEIL